MAEKKPRINTLARAFALLDAPDRPAGFKKPKLTRGAATSGEGLPEEYALILKAYGPFTLGWAAAHEPERFELLSPARSRELRAPMHQQLSAWWGPVGTAVPAEAEVVPVSVYYDLNSNESWTLYRGESLWFFGKKDPLEKADDEATLEEHLIERVCVFAQWSLATGTWWRD